MSTSHHVASHKEVTTSLPTSAVRILAALTLLVVGTFIGIVISHRVISAQVAHYGNTQMAGGSVLINVLDDIAPYLAYTMVGGVVLLPLTLTAWIWSRPMSRGLRNAAVVLLTGMIILFITLLVACKTEGPPASQAPTIPRTPVTRVTLTAAPPATEHHLTVTPPALVEASPSPEPTVYRNPAYHFEVAYPWDFIIDGACPTEGIIDSPVVSFRLWEASYYQGTNLLDACVVIDVDRREDARSTCQRAGLSRM